MTDMRACTSDVTTPATGAEQQIQEEAAKGILPERIVVGGFSQGGHIALKSLFKASQPLAACIALSTWLEPGLNWEVTAYLLDLICCFSSFMPKG